MLEFTKCLSEYQREDPDQTALQKNWLKQYFIHNALNIFIYTYIQCF